jgi:hypothetical protein
METFIAARAFGPDPHFESSRTAALAELNIADIDPPIADIISDFARIPWCFTLQSCWGHFVHDGQPDPRCCDPLAHYTEDTRGRYQLAYVAVCLKNSPEGRLLHDDLRAIVKLDPANIQFGSAEWFWNQQVNTYVLQVEPERFKTQDRAILDVREALYLEKLKVRMFNELRRIVEKHNSIVAG